MGADLSAPTQHLSTFNGCPSVSPLLEASALNVFSAIDAGFNRSCPRPNSLEELFIFCKEGVAVSLSLRAGSAECDVCWCHTEVNSDSAIYIWLAGVIHPSIGTVDVLSS